MLIWMITRVKQMENATEHGSPKMRLKKNWNRKWRGRDETKEKRNQIIKTNYKTDYELKRKKVLTVKKKKNVRSDNNEKEQ